MIHWSLLTTLLGLQNIVITAAAPAEIGVRQYPHDFGAPPTHPLPASWVLCF